MSKHARVGFVAVAVAAACGGSPPPPAQPRTLSRLGDLLASAGQPAAIEAQLAAPVELRGIVFPSEPCRSQFVAMRRVEQPELAALAGCLAALPMHVSARDSAAAGVRLVEYAPGLELEIAFARDREEKIRAIGFVSRVEASDASPTITQETFELALTQRALAPLGSAVVWAKICVDAAGAVTSVRPDLATDPLGVPAVVEQVKQWRIAPFLLDGAPTPVCAVVRLTSDPASRNTFVPRVPLPGQGDALTVDEASLGDRLAGDATIEPSGDERAEMRRQGRPELVGVVRYCVGADGRVQDAWTAASSGVAGWDARLLAAVKQWRYAAPPLPVCVFDEVIYRRD